MGTHSLLFFYFNNKLRFVICKSFDSYIDGIGNTIVQIVKYLKSIENEEQKIKYLRDLCNQEYFDQVSLEIKDFEEDTCYAYHIYLNENEELIKVNSKYFETNLDIPFKEGNYIYGVYYTLQEFQKLVELFSI